MDMNLSIKKLAERHNAPASFCLIENRVTTPIKRG